MHFSKTYARLLVTLPPELRNYGFEYRKLKRLINQTASELDSLGLGPSVLHPLHEDVHGPTHLKEPDGSGSDETLTVDFESVLDPSHRHTIVYEIVLNSTLPEPQLRLSSEFPSTSHNTILSAQPIYRVEFLIPEQSFSRIKRSLLYPPVMIEGEMRLPNNPTEPNNLSDLTIPLPSDTAFFQLLMSTLSSLSSHLDTLQGGFNSALNTLAASISSTARPASTTAPRSFSAYSITVSNSTSLRPRPGGKSDLYIWREIFRLYAEAEIFESIGESTRGERSIEEVERRLRLFQGRIQGRKASLVIPGSREAFDSFLNLNSFILAVKKFQLANSEATRKILKKHAKRTMIPIPSYLLERNTSTPTVSPGPVPLVSCPSQSLQRLLVQAVGEVLLPIVPYIDDYVCHICTSIAFKPIRLCCNHFFCVRCLAKMQRRRMSNCPMCRAPTVLRANPSNVDYGLLNLMADWFPIESLEKMRANEREVTQEQLEALGIADLRLCRIM